MQDSTEQSNIFNQYFASKSTVQNPKDPVPNLERKADISTLNFLNTSPLEVAKIIRNIKKSYISYCGIHIQIKIPLFFHPTCPIWGGGGIQ